MSSIEAVNLGGSIETQLSNELRVGGEYDQNLASFRPRSLFAKWTAKGAIPLEVTATYNVAANSAEVDVDYDNSGTRVQAALDSARKTILNTVELSRTFNVEGRDLEVSPAYDLSTKVDGLHEIAASLNAGFVDRGRRFVWRDHEPTFNFGKLRSKSLREVASDPTERDYLRWIMSGPFEDDVKELIREALEGKIRTTR